LEQRARNLEHDRGDVLTLEGVGLRMAVRTAAADERLASDVEDVEEPDEVEEEWIVAPARERLDSERAVVDHRLLAEAGRPACEVEILITPGTLELDEHLL